MVLERSGTLRKELTVQRMIKRFLCVGTGWGRGGGSQVKRVVRNQRMEDFYSSVWGEEIRLVKGDDTRSLQEKRKPKERF